MNNDRKLTPDDLDAVSGGTSGGSVVNSGSFKSNTGTALDIIVDWSVVRDSLGENTLEVQVFTQSYSLTSIALENGVELTVNGTMYRGRSAAVNYSGRTLATSLLASFSIPNLSGPLCLSAVWHFNGTYSGTPLTDIRAEGFANI